MYSDNDDKQNYDGLEWNYANLFESLLVNYGPFLGVVRAHYMVFWFGFLRREALRLGKNSGFIPNHG
jgi:hypothetical protein